MSHIIETPEAKQDLLDTWEYIADDSVRAADRWLEEIVKHFESLAESPRIGRERPELGEDLRSYPVGNYVIFYKPLENGVEIIRVVHGARDLRRVFGLK